MKWKKLINEVYHTSKNSNSNFYRLLLNKILFPLIPEKIKKIIRPVYIKNSKVSNMNKDFVKQINAERLIKNICLNPIIESDNAKKDHYRLITEENLLP